jgi:hypothetical protein
VEMLILVGRLCCVGFINTVGDVVGVLRQKLALSVGPPE